MSDDSFLCSVEGCDYHLDQSNPHINELYGSCQNCEEFVVCYKQDEKHRAALLYNEACRNHHGDGYSVCLECSSNAYKEKYDSQVDEESCHCLCPVCNHDFGILSNLRNGVVDEDRLVCSIQGCDYHLDPSNPHINELYGSCQNCEEFVVCYKQDDEHQAALLYNEGCREHHSGGYSVCLDCSSKAYDEKHHVDERCICPECDHDFGLLSDLQYQK